MTTAANPRKSDVIYANLGSNERAVVDNIRVPFVRWLVIRLVAIKLRLQFTGWLQYLIPLPITLVLFLLTGLAHLVGLQTVAGVLIWLPLTLSF